MGTSTNPVYRFCDDRVHTFWEEDWDEAINGWWALGKIFSQDLNTPPRIVSFIFSLLACVVVWISSINTFTRHSHDGLSIFHQTIWLIGSLSFACFTGKIWVNMWLWKRFQLNTLKNKVARYLGKNQGYTVSFSSINTSSYMVPTIFFAGIFIILYGSRLNVDSLYFRYRTYRLREPNFYEVISCFKHVETFSFVVGVLCVACSIFALLILRIQTKILFESNGLNVILKKIWPWQDKKELIPWSNINSMDFTYLTEMSIYCTNNTVKVYDLNRIYDDNGWMKFIASHLLHSTSDQERESFLKTISHRRIVNNLTQEAQNYLYENSPRT